MSYQNGVSLPLPSAPASASTAGKTKLVLLTRLIRMDFHKRYLGTLLGSAWAFLSPMVSILLIYFVMRFGLKVTAAMGQTPFIDWLIAGMLAWFYIQESISGGVTAILENPHFVTKMRFPLALLPLAKVITPFFVHLILMAVLLAYLFVTRGGTLYWLQLPYFMACAGILCLAIGYFTAAAMIFIRDTASVVGVILQVFFWATPIFWNPAYVADSRLGFILLSPFNYIVSGYRMCLFEKVWFWERPLETAIYWGATVLLLIFSHAFFRRTSVHFADVL